MLAKKISFPIDSVLNRIEAAIEAYPPAMLF